MRRADIVRRFDEIVAFSEMERFLETPVKRYSSGMYVRLAFAVAAHVEPDILIVDEVLAVGDINFQRKCLGRMADVAGEGRTVLFVSHNMGAIKQLCSRAILLEQGRLIADGDPNETIASYAKAMSEAPVGSRRKAAPQPGTGVAWVIEAKLLNSLGEEADQLYFSESFKLQAVIEAETAMNDAILEIGITTSDGVRVATLANTDGKGRHLVLEPGVQNVEVDIDIALLPRPDYAIDMTIHRSASGFIVDTAERILSFSVINVARDSSDHYPWDQVRGYVRPKARWSAAQRAPGSRRD
jgi:lipopolysaccharide transport system ATP-binding protein